MASAFGHSCWVRQLEAACWPCLFWLAFRSPLPTFELGRVRTVFDPVWPWLGAIDHQYWSWVVVFLGPIGSPTARRSWFSRPHWSRIFGTPSLDSPRQNDLAKFLMKPRFRLSSRMIWFSTHGWFWALIFGSYFYRVRVFVDFLLGLALRSRSQTKLTINKHHLISKIYHLLELFYNHETAKQAMFPRNQVFFLESWSWENKTPLTWRRGSQVVYLENIIIFIVNTLLILRSNDQKPHPCYNFEKPCT